MLFSSFISLYFYEEIQPLWNLRARSNTHNIRFMLFKCNVRVRKIFGKTYRASSANIKNNKLWHNSTIKDVPQQAFMLLPVVFCCWVSCFCSQWMLLAVCRSHRVKWRLTNNNCPPAKCRPTSASCRLWQHCAPRHHCQQLLSTTTIIIRPQIEKTTAVHDNITAAQATAAAHSMTHS